MMEAFDVAQNFESLVEILRMTEMQPFLQYFYMILFPYYVVLTFEPLAEILGWDHSHESSACILQNWELCKFF